MLRRSTPADRSTSRRRAWSPLAAERGRIGEKYILAPNLTSSRWRALRDHGCARRAPDPVCGGVARRRLAWSRGRVTAARRGCPLTAVRMSRAQCTHSAKAGASSLPQTDGARGVRDATDWFVEHGYVTGVRKTA